MRIGYFVEIFIVFAPALVLEMEKPFSVGILTEDTFMKSHIWFYYEVRQQHF
jgi:hypothetical protein